MAAAQKKVSVIESMDFFLGYWVITHSGPDNVCHVVLWVECELSWWNVTKLLVLGVTYDIVHSSSWRLVSTGT